MKFCKHLLRVCIKYCGDMCLHLYNITTKIEYTNFSFINYKKYKLSI